MYYRVPFNVLCHAIKKNISSVTNCQYRSFKNTCYDYQIPSMEEPIIKKADLKANFDTKKELRKLEHITKIDPSTTDVPIIVVACKNISLEFKKGVFVDVKKGQEHSGEQVPKLLVEESLILKKIHSLLSKESQAIGVLKENSLSEADVGPTATADEWHCQTIEWKKLPYYYSGLAKSRLTLLVVITAVTGYLLSPAPFGFVTLSSCLFGTALTSAAANSFNQFLEVPYDSQMNRTKNRVLVKGQLTPLHAVLYGTFCFTSGISLLYFGANEVTAILGASNFFLYTTVYTPLKRISILNTWVGSVVGAIPPLMGYAACSGSLDVGAFLMAGILYAWQFPHFNSLSWNLRPDYSRAGYRMMSVVNPDLCRRTALRYSAVISILSLLAPVCNVTTWTYFLFATPYNIYYTHLAWIFYKKADRQSSRKLFLSSLIYLPYLFVLMVLTKTNNENYSDLMKFFS